MTKPAVNAILKIYTYKLYQLNACYMIVNDDSAWDILIKLLVANNRWFVVLVDLASTGS